MWARSRVSSAMAVLTAHVAMVSWSVSESLVASKPTIIGDIKGAACPSSHPAHVARLTNAADDYHRQVVWRRVPPLLKWLASLLSPVVALPLSGVGFPGIEQPAQPSWNHVLFAQRSGATEVAASAGHHRTLVIGRWSALHLRRLERERAQGSRSATTTSSS